MRRILKVSGAVGGISARFGRGLSATPSSSDRPFRVLGLQQIAIGGLSKTNLSGLWEGIFGVEKVGSFQSEKENVDEDILKLGSGAHAVEVDLM